MKQIFTIVAVVILIESENLVTSIRQKRQLSPAVFLDYKLGPYERINQIHRWGYLPYLTQPLEIQQLGKRDEAGISAAKRKAIYRTNNFNEYRYQSNPLDEVATLFDSA